MHSDNPALRAAQAVSQSDSLRKLRRSLSPLALARIPMARPRPSRSVSMRRRRACSRWRLGRGLLQALQVAASWQLATRRARLTYSLRHSDNRRSHREATILRWVLLQRRQVTWRQRSGMRPWLGAHTPPRSDLRRTPELITPLRLVRPPPPRAIMRSPWAIPPWPRPPIRLRSARVHKRREGGMQQHLAPARSLGGWSRLRSAVVPGRR